MFDSHVATLLDVSAALVNTLTDGTARGRPYTAPRDGDLPTAVTAALPGEARVEPAAAAHLARTADQLRAVFEAVEDHRIDAAADRLNTLLRTTGARPQLDRVPGEPWQVHFHGADDTLAVGWSAGCATALALALGSDLAGRLGVCQAPRCDRVYVDTSRNAARRFCSTACQSRVKAATFRARHTPGH
ncbi:CGNR zinc finger domain-containing protein [Streptomyces phytophilus]|uniref:CGNR zinc finger domain-containing protein n=1 Tax=Streptomyces phytophilus TaxID=722715 RepID=UPI0015F0276A|nr:CGNR zinc finger domain-containing protein [Streptomyces phytophilus]